MSQTHVDILCGRNKMCIEKRYKDIYTCINENHHETKEEEIVEVENSNKERKRRSKTKTQSFVLSSK